jgi:4-amino-4-deoxy-L-arabinose transferase-like glycosyltransferase
MESIKEKVFSILRDKWPLAVILILVAISRFGHLIFLHPPLIWADSSIYDRSAWNFVQGLGYTLNEGGPFAGREPGYALFLLAPIYFIFGHSILAVQIFQILLSMVLVALMYVVAERFFSKKVAILASLFYLAHPLFLAYPSEVLTEIPFTFLLFGAVMLVYLAVERGSLKLCLAGGAVLGLATLFRFISVFLPIFLLVYFYIAFGKDWKKSLRYFGVLCASFMIFILPWIVRNYVVFDTFIFGRTGGGVMYWSGSYVPWDGDWRGYREPPLDELNKGLSDLESDRKFSRLAMENIKNDPVGVLKIWLKKPIKLFWKGEFNTVLERKNKMADFFDKNKLINAAFIINSFRLFNVFLVLFAFLGSFYAYKKNRLAVLLFVAVIAYFMIFYLPMNPDSRYKMPILPYIMILAGVGFFNFCGLIYTKVAGLLISRSK